MSTEKPGLLARGFPPSTCHHGPYFFNPAYEMHHRPLSPSSADGDHDAPPSPAEDVSELPLPEVYDRLREVGRQFADNARRYDQIAPGMMRPADFQRQIRRFRLRRHELETRRAALRERAMALSRPHLRPLTLLDVPDEILLAVCEATQRRENEPWSRDLVVVRGKRLHHDHHDQQQQQQQRQQQHPAAEGGRQQDVDDARGRAGVEAVRCLRLTCRRLCVVSSPLMVPRLRVEMTPASLGRMRRIVGHPLFRAGIKTMSLCLAYYDDELAMNLSTFAIYQALLLLEAKFRYCPPISPPLRPRRRRRGGTTAFTVSDWESEQNIFQVAEDVVDALRHWDAPPEAMDERQRTYTAILRQAHAEYMRRWAAQKTLLSGQRTGYVAAVAAAAAKLNAGVHLEFHDVDPAEAKRRAELESLSHRLHSDRSLFESMLLPHRWNWYVWGPTRPARIGRSPGWLLLDIPAAIQNAGGTINSLKFEIWPTTAFEPVQMGEAQRAAIRKSVHHTKSIVIDSLDPVRQSSIWDVTLDRGRERAIIEYIQTLLDTPGVESIELNFGWLNHSVKPHADNWILAGTGGTQTPAVNPPQAPDPSSVLTFRIWPRIQFIHLHLVALPYPRLRLFIQNIAGTECKAVVFSSCMLQTGSWRNALDYIREKTLDHPCRVTIRKPGDHGLDEYTRTEMALIFGVTMPQVRNLAGKYMDGTIEVNPFDILDAEGEEGLLELDGPPMGAMGRFPSWSPSD
jgi:hypothetical protein